MKRQYRAGDRVGRYRLIRLLGRGGMGLVFEAEPEHGGPTVALKLPADPESAKARKRMVREYEILTKLARCSCVAKVYELLDQDGILGIVMERLEGETLKERLNRGPLHYVEVIHYALACARAMRSVHGHRLVHRDLKPSNLFLVQSGRLKRRSRLVVLDFGIALALGESRGVAVPVLKTRESSNGDETETQTADGQVEGTGPYMSPEHRCGAAPDFKTDVYSLGIILYECLTGCRPGERGREDLTVAAGPLSEAAIALPRELRNGVERLLEDMCSTSPDIRPDMDEAVQRLGKMSCVEQTSEARWPSMAKVMVPLTALLLLPPNTERAPRSHADLVASPKGRILDGAEQSTSSQTSPFWNRKSGLPSVDDGAEQSTSSQTSPFWNRKSGLPSLDLMKIPARAVQRPMTDGALCDDDWWPGPESVHFRRTAVGEPARTAVVPATPLHGANLTSPSR